MERILRVSQHLQANETAGIEVADAMRDTYDYVVVGGGSAGCVVASRLSEDPKVSVLLLEAGGTNQTFAVRNPLLTCPDLQNSDVDWAYRTEPQPNTSDRVSHWPRGKCLGGSSSINYMIYCRGDPRNFDQWSNQYGCEGWSYQEVLPYFKKSEKLTHGEEVAHFHDANSHGTNGPLPVTSVADASIEFSTREACERFVKSCDESGIPGPVDYNGPVQHGASMCQITIQDGKRCDTASTFLYDSGALDRPNLTVCQYAHVTKVATQSGTAVGVCFKSANLGLQQLASPTIPFKYVAAKKEVILCAGAIGTPQLLMLSGIGPKQHLEDHGIPVVIDLPAVGENLQDHLMVPMYFPVLEQHSMFNGSIPHVVKEILNFFIRAQGIMMLPFVLAVAFFRSGIRPEEDGNDLQIHYVPYIDKDSGRAKSNVGFDDEKNPRYSGDHLPEKGVLFLPSLVRPFSSGNVRLRSADPFDHPILNPRFLEDPRDKDMLKICYHKCRDIAQKSPAFQGYLGPQTVNPFSKFEPFSDEYVDEEIRDTVITIYHHAGTAKMGPVEDPSTVVDCKTLKVKGVEGLRVADASVMPDVISGNTNAPSIMIGERVAAFIQGKQ